MENEETQYMVVGNFRLSRIDEHNLEVEEFKLVKARKGRYVKEARETEKWVSVGFYGNVYQALGRMYQETAVGNLNSDIGELMVEMKEAEERIQLAVVDAGLVLQSFPKPVSERGRKTVVTVEEK